MLEFKRKLKKNLKTIFVISINVVARQCYNTFFESDDRAQQARVFVQGSLTEGEGSVRLTSSLTCHFLYKSQ
jgi:hypothetical protein